MEKRVIRTLVRADRMLGNSEYVLGKIVGAQDVLCGWIPNAGYAIQCLENGDRVISVETTDEAYAEFAKVIEALFEDLCVFYYSESE